MFEQLRFLECSVNFELLTRFNGFRVFKVWTVLIFGMYRLWKGFILFGGFKGLILHVGSIFIHFWCFYSDVQDIQMFPQF